MKLDLKKYAAIAACRNILLSFCTVLLVHIIIFNHPLFFTPGSKAYKCSSKIQIIMYILFLLLFLYKTLKLCVWNTVIKWCVVNDRFYSIFIAFEDMPSGESVVSSSKASRSSYVRYHADRNFAHSCIVPRLGKDGGFVFIQREFLSQFRQ